MGKGAFEHMRTAKAKSACMSAQSLFFPLTEVLSTMQSISD